MKQKVLVIGGSGYIGYAVIKKLLSENIHIINYDCLMFKGQKNAFKKRKNYKFLKADLSEIDNEEKAINLRDVFSSIKEKHKRVNIVMSQGIRELISKSKEDNIDFSTFLVFE